MKAVYIETTIPNAYASQREDAASLLSPVVINPDGLWTEGVS